MYHHVVQNNVNVGREHKEGKMSLQEVKGGSKSRTRGENIWLSHKIYILDSIPLQVMNGAHCSLTSFMRLASFMRLRVDRTYDHSHSWVTPCFLPSNRTEKPQITVTNQSLPSVI